MRSRLLSTLLAFALMAPVVGETARPADASANASASLAVKRAKVVRYARRFLGVRYRYGGVSPRTGFDCSGFVAFVYRHFGVALPHYSVAQFGLGRRVPRRSLRPGDLLFFDGLGHVGIYVGKGRFIHAPHSGTRVSIEPLAGWYSSRYDGARRLRIAVS
jgi:cell wall-associated NlpC family hydrolase